MQINQLSIFKLTIVLMLITISACKPINELKNTPEIAIISVSYDPTIYKFYPDRGVKKDLVFSEFTGTPLHREYHENNLNEFLINFMTLSFQQSRVSFVRPLKLLNTSLLTKNDRLIRYELLLDPYESIDIKNVKFMGGIAERLNVDAVIDINISFAIYLDEKTLWEEYKDPYAKTLNSHQMQLRHGHESSELRTTITLTVINKNGKLIYNESRFVDSDSDIISITNTDLSFPGGVSPRLIELGLKDWLNDWIDYIPRRLIR